MQVIDGNSMWDKQVIGAKFMEYCVRGLSLDATGSVLNILQFTDRLQNSLIETMNLCL